MPLSFKRLYYFGLLVKLFPFFSVASLYSVSDVQILKPHDFPLSFMMQMFSPPSGQAPPSNDMKRHCILVTASNPYSLPTPVYRPKLQNAERNENGGAQSESRLSDAETVASYFSRVGFL